MNATRYAMLAVVLSLGLLCPGAAAEGRGDHGEPPPRDDASTSASGGSGELALGPPDPNGCRPYCR